MGSSTVSFFSKCLITPPPTAQAGKNSRLCLFYTIFPATSAEIVVWWALVDSASKLVNLLHVSHIIFINLISYTVKTMIYMYNNKKYKTRLYLAKAFHTITVKNSSVCLTLNNKGKTFRSRWQRCHGPDVTSHPLLPKTKKTRKVSLDSGLTNQTKLYDSLYPSSRRKRPNRLRLCLWTVARTQWWVGRTSFVPCFDGYRPPQIIRSLCSPLKRRGLAQ